MRQSKIYVSCFPVKSVFLGKIDKHYIFGILKSIFETSYN